MLKTFTLNQDDITTAIGRYLLDENYISTIEFGENIGIMFSLNENDTFTVIASDDREN